MPLGSGTSCRAAIMGWRGEVPVGGRECTKTSDARYAIRETAAREGEAAMAGEDEREARESLSQNTDWISRCRIRDEGFVAHLVRSKLFCGGAETSGLTARLGEIWRARDGAEAGWDAVEDKKIY